MIKVSPSLLSADFLNLGAEVAQIENSGADSIHIDVMDGRFVPNLTFGPLIIRQVKGITNLPIMVHLMISNAEQTFQDYIDAGANTIFVHSEACVHVDRLLTMIKKQNVKVGLAINPSTHESVLEYLYSSIDTILVMTVNPGFAAQSFLMSQLRKIEVLKERITKLGNDIEIAVDGGIDYEIAGLVVSAGADVLVTGSYLFSEPSSFGQKVKSLKSLISKKSPSKV
ncbi:ribulose-phosphate 3-epimerase [Neorickettsia helminthoeca str. Oregon]|uniref:Ribulose-phosphate 3-epimerase n=1 Tax=Neorickettsia helminthoeca str. Oregon TaxID=1286528 RepID=X5H3X8_9RICK|nr:ribulose-phosphate 3-epimerase [Neorickettsia helminthoeca]AHX11276.1 ribulose-phosphate 3-epimerase [Neorickettsia helminthoeca str. Oregon]